MKILIVDDEQNIRDSIKRAMELERIETVCAENGLSGQRLLQQEVFSAGIVDLKMPGMNGLELLRWARDQGLRVPMIMISAYGEIDDAVTAMKLGAQDYIIKPFSFDELLLRVKKVIEDQTLRDLLESGKRSEMAEYGLTGENPAIRDIRATISKIARAPSTVLIVGESGCGKEVIARSIHFQSTHSEGPFVAVNVGGLPETLIESELFGFEKGAFTGATARKIGMFELASSGTLFLDEIGEMPMPLQVKLLRVLQERRIRRLGGTQDIPIDPRIISATNRNLNRMVKEGNFREDLFYRLNVVRIDVPPLRDRLDDIPLLIGRFLEKLNRRMGKTIRCVSPEACKKLQGYTFPGNVRELENIIERAFIFTDSDTIDSKDICIEGIGLQSVPASDESTEKKTEPLTMRDIEKRSIIEALHRWDGNRTKAAEELGISRRSIFNKIREYDIDV
jgi:two-component system response regulator AtoC